MYNIVLLLVGIYITYVCRSSLKNIFRFYTFRDLVPAESSKEQPVSSVFELLFLNYGLSFIVVSLVPPETYSRYTVELASTLPEALARLVYVAVVEEALFRIIPWFVLYILRRYYNNSLFVEKLHIVGAIIISLFFGFLHSTNFINPDLAVYFSTLGQSIGGLLLWYLLEKKGTYAPILMHFLFNFFIWLIGYLLI